MPYPNPSDPELRERMRHLDGSCSGSAGVAGRKLPALSGRQYYEDLCMKAVNQCVGRVIRHAGDYAAIVLVDVRWAAGGGGGPGSAQQAGAAAAPGPAGKLPAWIRRSWQWAGGGDYDTAAGLLANFYRRCRCREGGGAA